MSRTTIWCRLLEGRQDRRATDFPKRGEEGIVGSRIGWRAEIDVEGHLLRACSLEPMQQLRMQPARPGPHADLIDRGRIDGDHDDVTASRPRLPGEAQIGERIAKRAVPSRGQHDRQRDHDKDMWPIAFHLAPLHGRRMPPGAPLSVSATLLVMTLASPPTVVVAVVAVSVVAVVAVSAIAVAVATASVAGRASPAASASRASAGQVAA